jgi:hypothetical protein
MGTMHSGSTWRTRGKILRSSTADDELVDLRRIVDESTADHSRIQIAGELNRLAEISRLYLSQQPGADVALRDGIRSLSASFTPRP